MSKSPSALLLLPRLKVQNANAISGPFSWGFPAPSAFTGFAHALSRRLPDALGLNLALSGVGIVCHQFEPQMSGGYVKNFRLTRNPNDQNGDPSPFVEEGRTHFEISLLIGVDGTGLDELGSEWEFLGVAKRILSHAQSLRLAGGSILPAPDDPLHEPVLQLLPDSPEDIRAFYRKKLRNRLIPGFALVGREDRLQQRLQELKQGASGSTPLDALLDLCALHFDCQAVQNEKGEVQAAWSRRRRRGWLVPVAVGYAAISPLYDAGAVQNVRDKTVPFRFVESVYSLGEWISPHRFDDPCRLLWHHQAEPDRGLYRCINDCFKSESSII